MTSQEREQESTERRERERIYIIGVGSIGKLLAHSIASVDGSPPLTLMYHRPAYVHDLTDGKCDIEVTSPDGDVTMAQGLDVELNIDEHGQGSARNYIPREEIMNSYPNLVSEAPIKHLIVTVKAHLTVQVLKPLKHRLSPQSTVLLCQNGMGVLEDLFEHVWPELEKDSRPNFMQCVNSHGAYATGPFSAVHAGRGVIYVAMLPPSRTKAAPQQFDPTTPVAESSMQLLRALTNVPVLGAVSVPYTNLLERALEKLAVNCVINPFTSLLDCHNGDLLYNFHLTRGMRMILAEVSLVFRNLPELKGVPNVELALSPERLEVAVKDVARKTSKNVSSMLQDTRRAQETEIAYMNGYVVRRGEEMGIKPVMNYLIMQLIKGKEHLISRESTGYLPLGQADQDEQSDPLEARQSYDGSD